MPGGSYYKQKGVGTKRSYNAGVAAGLQKAKKRKYGGTAMTSSQRGYVRREGYYGRYNRAGAARGEKKFLDTNIGTAVGTVGAVMDVADCTIIASGTGESERIGRKITLHSVAVNGFLTLGPTVVDVANTSTVVSMRIIQDSQTNGAKFVGTDLQETDTYTSFNNLVNSGRFRTLHKQTFELVSKAGATAIVWGEDVRDVSAHVPLNIPIEYSSTTGAVTEVRSNNIYIVFQSSSGNLATFTGFCRVRFTDS